MSRVLVAHATYHGSTRSIAEHIADRLRADGHDAECRPVATVDGVASYDVVIAGSAVHGQAWLPEGVAFLRRTSGELAGRPVWLFSVGMPGALLRWMQRWAMQEEPKIVAPLRAFVRPEEHRLFSGVIEKSHLPLGGRIALHAMGARYGDYRDWPQIDAWADRISTSLAVAAG
jgi:menaquinone-dependent protoporphyrinogen oxidase